MTVLHKLGSYIAGALVGAVLLLLCFPAHSQTACNSPSGFLKSYGPMVTGDVLILGPDCEHLMDLGVQLAGSITTRAFAQTLDLSGAAGIRTHGYAAAGDGGDAIFRNVGSAPFIDSQIIDGTIINQGSGCANGSYFGIWPAGGTGKKTIAMATVAGGVMTAFALTTPGNAYTVGDILTPNGVGGNTISCTVQPQWRVDHVTAPLASFTDRVGTHFQFVVGDGNYPNVRQFGAVLNRAGLANDGLATNDRASMQAGLWFSNYGVGFIDAIGYAGNRLILSTGSGLVCGGGGLIVPLGVSFEGVTETGSELKLCDGEAATTSLITLGDPLSHQTAFFASVRRMTLFGSVTAISGTVPMIYSNSVQGDMVVDVSIYPLTRSCVFTEIGYGGPSLNHISNMYCVPNTVLTPFGISLNGASNIIVDNGTWFSAGGTPWAQSAILINTNGPVAVGRYIDVHCENLAVCALVNVPAGGNAPMTFISGMVGNVTVTDIIQRSVGSVAGQLTAEFLAANGSNCTVRNAGPCAVVGNLQARTVY